MQKVKPPLLSSSTVVLNSRDRHEKTWRPTFTRLTIYFSQKNQLKSVCNTITKLYLRGKPNDTICREISEF